MAFNTWDKKRIMVEIPSESPHVAHRAVTAAKRAKPDHQVVVVVRRPSRALRRESRFKIRIRIAGGAITGLLASAWASAPQSP